MAKRIDIILDAAHGKDVPGKRSPDNRHFEWKWSRMIISKLKPKLESLGYIVHETNKTDNEIGLNRRVEIANSIRSKNNKKVLLSIHNNAAGNGSSWMNATGFSFYTTKGQTTSDKFADACWIAFHKMFPNENHREDMSDGDKDWEANFAVLLGKGYYAVLAECMFQDNKKDVEKLLDPAFNEKIVDAFVNAIESFESYIAKIN